VEKQYETKLLPNEMKISTKGNVESYFNQAMIVLFERGYSHLKMVARGTACELGCALSAVIYER